jgi:hypothetical protein
LGFFGGFFGPGTGSFFSFLLIRYAGMNSWGLRVTAKILNATTNLAAISYFSVTWG